MGVRIGQIRTIVALWVTFTAGPSEAQVPEPPPAALVDARLVNDLLLDAIDADRTKATWGLWIDEFRQAMTPSDLAAGIKPRGYRLPVSSWKNHESRKRGFTA